jgi:hypothetical protein
MEYLLVTTYTPTSWVPDAAWVWVAQTLPSFSHVPFAVCPLSRLFPLVSPCPFLRLSPSLPRPPRCMLKSAPIKPTSHDRWRVRPSPNPHHRPFPTRHLPPSPSPPPYTNRIWRALMWHNALHPVTLPQRTRLGNVTQCTLLVLGIPSVAMTSE